jgi:hypothetical protein
MALEKQIIVDKIEIVGDLQNGTSEDSNTDCGGRQRHLIVLPPARCSTRPRLFSRRR